MGKAKSVAKIDNNLKRLHIYISHKYIYCIGLLFLFCIYTNLQPGLFCVSALCSCWLPIHSENQQLHLNE